MALLGCSDDATPRAPPLLCNDLDGGCNRTGGGGGGGGGGFDAGVTLRDAGSGGLDAGADGRVTVSGRVVVYQDIVGPALGGASTPGAGWTLRSSRDEALSGLSSDTGGFSLSGIPSEVFAGTAGRFYGLLASPPVTRELGSFRYYPADGSLAIVPAVGFDALQTAVAGANGVVDLDAAHVIVLVRDSFDTGGMPLAGVSVQARSQPVVTYYDSALQSGQLQVGDPRTGNRGIAAVLNLSVPREGAGSATLVLSGVGASVNLDVPLYRRTVTWVTWVPRS